jgi:hypothetical protein
MLDNFDRRSAGTMPSGNYWSAIINPALMSFNDFSNFFLYQRNLAAMQHHYQQQQHQHEMLIRNYNNSLAEKKRPAPQRCDSESPKPKRQKVSEGLNSGKSKQPRPIVAASVVGLDNPEILRAETITPNSNKSGLITFRPHSDILTSCLEKSGGCSKAQQHRKKCENGETKKVECVSPILSKNNLSNLLSTKSDVWEEGDGAITRLFPEILTIIFQYLDITSKGRVAQVNLLF